MFKIRKDYIKIILFLMVIKDFCFKQVHKYARPSKTITGFLRVLVKKFWHFQRVNTKLYYTRFVRVYFKQYWNFQIDTTTQDTFCIKQYCYFWRATTKQYYTHFSGFLSHNIFSWSHYSKLVLKSLRKKICFCSFEILSSSWLIRKLTSNTSILGCL